MNDNFTGKSTSRVERQQVLKGVKRTATHAERKNNPVTLASDAELSSVDAADNSLEKNYNPDLFAGTHVTELLAENAALKNKVLLTFVASAVAQSLDLIFVVCFAVCCRKPSGCLVGTNRVSGSRAQQSDI